MRRPPRTQGDVVLGDGTELPVLYEDRAVMVIDKPVGWMFVPLGWARTDHNLQLALESSIREAPHWVRKRNLRYLRYIHRLDAETTGAVMLAKSPGALETYAKLFERRQIHKRYFAVVEDPVEEPEWRCDWPLTSSSGPRSRVEIDEELGREARTDFRVLERSAGRTLLEACPWTGRTHQIRAHLAACGLPIAGDELYGAEPESGGPARGWRAESALGLRAVELRYVDPFSRREIHVTAPAKPFLQRYGFSMKHDPRPPKPQQDEKKQLSA